MPRNLISGILFSLAILLGILLVWPNYQKLDNLWLQIERKEADFRNTEEYYKELSSLSERLKEFEPELARIEAALPSDSSLPSLYNFLQRAASENGLILQRIGGSSTEAFSVKPELKETSDSLNLSGSYSSFKNFLIALENNSRMVEIENISFSSPKEGEIFNLDITLKTYSY